jgi:hypothetical protein
MEVIVLGTPVKVAARCSKEEREWLVHEFNKHIKLLSGHDVDFSKLPPIKWPLITIKCLPIEW